MNNYWGLFAFFVCDIVSFVIKNYLWQTIQYKANAKKVKALGIDAGIIGQVTGLEPGEIGLKVEYFNS